MGDSDTTIAISALIISVVALISTVLQVLQQYLASADGFRRCAGSVMGLWAKGTHRKFRRRELRFEVVFETPVIFLAPPGNPRGPIPKQRIMEVTGTQESYADTNTMEPGKEMQFNVHTADDEQASWVTLLVAIQREEAVSRAWEALHRTSPRGNQYPDPRYTICHSIQKKIRSWDFMPATIIKPFATSALCHIVEMVGMLGMFWKDFKVGEGNLRAEGNGYMLTSTLSQGLGIMLTFSMTGPQVPKFEETRVIPCIEIKDLVFGSVPCILDHNLEVGSTKAAIRTLGTLGCSDDAIRAFELHRDRPFMFSVTFELIAMLANPFRIPASNFKMLPNPTHDFWISDLNMMDCVRAFKKRLDMLVDPIPAAVRHPILVFLLSFFTDHFTDKILSGTIDLDVREAAQAGLNLTKSELLPTIDKRLIPSIIAAHLSGVLSASDMLQTAVNDLSASKEENLMKYYFEEIKPTVKNGYANVRTANNSGGMSPTTIGTTTEAQKEEREAVWTMLVFRMWCWFLLHEFDPADRCIVPNQFKGSRMPVYIG